MTTITPPFPIKGGGASKLHPVPISIHGNNNVLVSQNRYNYYVSNCVIVLKCLYIIQNACI